MYEYDYLRNNNILDPYQGFIKGNMFNNLYIPYKNYKSKQLNPSNDREALMYQLMEYNFALNDLNLYLDLNRRDTYALGLYNKYLKIRDDIKEKYERIYGPICNNFASQNEFDYVKTMWPWEGYYNV